MVAGFTLKDGEVGGGASAVVESETHAVAARGGGDEAGELFALPVGEVEVIQADDAGTA